MDEDAVPTEAELPGAVAPVGHRYPAGITDFGFLYAQIVDLQAQLQGVLAALQLTLSADGTAASPAVTWSGDPNTGVYRLSEDNLGIACGGGASAVFGASQINLNRNVVLVNGSGVELYFSGDMQSEIKTDDTLVIDFDRNANGGGANFMQIRAGGSTRLHIHDQPQVIQQGGDSDTPTVWQYKSADALTAAVGSELQIKSGESAGTNQAGSILRLMGGQGTGNGAEGPIILAASAAGSSGSTLQQQTERARIDHRGLVMADGHALVAGTTTGLKIGSGPTEKLGLFGVTPVVQSAAYTVTNPSVSRSLDVSTATLAQVAAVLGTVVSDLRALGVLG